MKHEAAIQEPKQDHAPSSPWSELVKLRLTTMVLITTAMVFLASANGFDWALLLHALFGTAFWWAQRPE